MGVTFTKNVASLGHLMTVHIERSITDEIDLAITESVRDYVRSAISTNEELKQVIREKTQELLETSLRKIVEEVVHGQQETK